MVEDTRWRPGQSGNPDGKPPGSGQVQKLRAAISEHIPEIIGRLVEQAKAGDAQSARLLLERVLPPIKAAELPVLISLPDGGLTDQGRAVLAAAGAGELPPTQAAQLLASLGALAKLIETDELARRIEALEAQNQTGAKR
jgi:hypothetical protein